MYLATSFIAPAIHLFINRYLQATAHYSPIIYLYLKLSVKIHKEAGETLTHSVLLLFTSLFLLISIALTIINTFSACFFDLRCGLINLGIFGAALTSRFSGHSGPSILLSSSIPDSIFARQSSSLLLWIIKVPIQVKPIFRFRNDLSCAILITFDGTMVDSSDSPDIQYLSSSPREVGCSQRWLQRRSFWQLKCSRTIMMKELPRCFDHLFRVRNVSHSSHLLVMSAGFLLGSTQVLAAVPQLETIVNLSHSVQVPFLHLFLHSLVVFCVPYIKVRVSAGPNPCIGSSELPWTTMSRVVSLGVYDCLQLIISQLREKLASNPTACGMIESTSHATLEESTYFDCVSSCWCHQSDMSGNQNILLITTGSEW